MSLIDLQANYVRSVKESLSFQERETETERDLVAFSENRGKKWEWVELVSLRDLHKDYIVT